MMGMAIEGFRSVSSGMMPVDDAGADRLQEPTSNRATGMRNEPINSSFRQLAIRLLAGRNETLLDLRRMRLRSYALKATLGREEVSKIFRLLTLDRDTP